MSTLQIILVLLLVACFGATGFWMVALFRTAASMRASISMRTGARMPEPQSGWPRVSVVIPAHDEEAVIEQCARSLAAQEYPDLEVIFALDRCTDRTESILRSIVGEDERFRIEIVESCPDDWAGKCNAAHAGAAQATGEFLIFTDADTVFDPELVRSSVAIAQREKVDLLSVLSTLTARRWDERIVQPVAVYNLLRMHPIDLVNRRKRPRAFANGQFMLFSRSMYDRVGGHAHVHRDLLEDIAFARSVQGNGGRSIVVNADGMLKVAMYDSLSDLREGWKRIYIEVARRRPSRLTAWGVRTLATGILVPLMQVATIVIGAVLGANGDTTGFVLALCAVGSGLLFEAFVLGWIYQMSGFPIAGILGFPFGCIVVASTMFEGARDITKGRPIRWGGREYVLKPN